MSENNRVQYSIIRTVLGVHSVTRIYMRRLKLGLTGLTSRREMIFPNSDTCMIPSPTGLAGIILYQAIQKTGYMAQRPA